MKSKLVAMLLFITIIASIMTVPVFAYEESIYSDYEPGEMPENMFKTDEEISNEYDGYGFLDFVRSAYQQADNPAVSVEKTDSTCIITANGEPGSKMLTTAPIDKYYTRGVYFDRNAIKGNNKYTNTSGDRIIIGDIAGGKNYVYSIQVRNKNADIEPNVHFLLYDGDEASSPYMHYSEEHGSDGMKITGTDWVEFKGSISNPSDGGKEQNDGNADKISLGFPFLQTYSESSVEINCTGTGSGMHLPYFAQEALYDITNELVSGSATINHRSAGAAFKAELVNQIGLPGCIVQGTFTWKALDKATRLTEIQGIKVTPSDDTTTATVTVDETVAPGEYVIAAKSDAHAMAKGFVITVEKPNYYDDYVRGTMPANLIDSGTSVDSTRLQYFSQGKTDKTDAKVDYNKVSSNDWTSIKIISQKKYDGTTLMGTTNDCYLPGAEIHKGIMPKPLEEGKNYVVSFWAKASEGQDGTVRDTKVNIGVTNFKNSSQIDYTKEYDETGMNVTSGSWQQFKGSVNVSAPVISAEETPLIHIGLSTKALQGTGVTISDGLNGEPGKVYIAEEVAYDITNTTSDNTVLANGAQAAFSAQVVNQIGLPGYINQDFEWRVMNKERTADIDGFVITEGEEGTATVTVNGAAAGTYDVVAYNAENKIAKGVEIKVLGEEVTAIALSKTENKVTLTSVDVANSTAEKILVVLASYTNTEGVKRIVDVNKAELTVSGGAARLSDEITIAVNQGNDVRVFVWNAANIAPIKLADGVIAEYKIL